MKQEELLKKDIAPLIGLDALSEEEREETLSRLGELIMEGVMLRALADMTDEEAGAFEEFIATNPAPEAVTEYLEEKVPDIDRIFADEVSAFKEETIAVMERTKGAGTDPV